MEISEKTEGAVNVVSLSGRMDTYTANDVEQKLDSLAAVKQVHLVINLRELEYISSVGLRVLLATLKKATKQKGEVRLACLNPSVKDVLDIAGFTQFFKIYDKEEDAINSF
ncbi:STAS domain-containing protein [Chloroflexota bacterium]